MPFGWGPRNCVGSRFALMEAKMALLTILRKYKFRIAPDTQVKTHIVVTPTSYHQSACVHKVDSPMIISFLLFCYP